MAFSFEIGPELSWLTIDRQTANSPLCLVMIYHFECRSITCQVAEFVRALAHRVIAEVGEFSPRILQGTRGLQIPLGVRNDLDQS